MLLVGSKSARASGLWDVARFVARAQTPPSHLPSPPAPPIDRPLLASTIEASHIPSLVVDDITATTPPIPILIHITSREPLVLPSSST